MDLDEPPSDTGNTDTGNTTGHEVAQNTGESSKFLIRCETGPIAGAAWISPPPTSKVYEENQKVMKILREEQENSQAPVPSTSAGARGLAVTAEMSNQDIKVSIAPSDTQSSGSESDLDSAKWSIACRKTTALDIVTIMAGNTDAAVALVENLIAKKYTFKMDHGPEITCGKDWLRINIPKNAKVRKGKGKGRSDKKSPKGKGDSKSLPKSPPRSPPKSPPKAPGSSQKYRGKPPTKERRDLCARKTPKQSKGADDKMSKQTNKKLEEEAKKLT